MLSRRDSLKQTDAKFALLGSRQVGKSAIAVRFLTKRFIGEYDSSQDCTYQFSTTIDDDQVNLEVLDPAPLPGGELGERLLENKVIWADGVLLVYSVTDRQSFDKLLDFYKALVPLKQKPIVVVVGNKSDLEHERQVSEHKGAQLAEDLKCSFVECSASEGHEKITKAFHELYRDALRKKKDRRVSLSPRPLRNALGKVFRRNSSKSLLLTPGSSS